MARAKRPALLREIRRQTGCTLGEARFALDRVERWLYRRGERLSIASLRRHPKKVREYVSLAQGFVPPGWEVEVTLRTKGGTYRRDGKRVVDHRPLYVKVIVTAREALPISEHERAVRMTIRAGAVPLGFKIWLMDWEKGEGRNLNAGSLRAVAELIAFYGALRHPNTEIRADMVAREEEM